MENNTIVWYALEYSIENMWYESTLTAETLAEIKEHRQNMMRDGRPYRIVKKTLNSEVIHD
jgi:uncharacterized protein YjhX (UPF0386 family)